VDPKRIHTRTHHDPEPFKVVYDPKKLIRKRSLEEIQGSSSPPPRETSLPEKFVTIQDIQFDVPFKNRLFKTKSESFVDETVLNQVVFQPNTPERQSPESDLDQPILQNFENLQDLASDFYQSLHEAYIQQSVELSALTIYGSSINPQLVHPISTRPASSVFSTTSPTTSQTVIQPIIGVLESTPSTISSTIHPPIPIMEARYAPLILATPLHNMPQEYKTRIRQFDGTGTMTAQQHVDKMNDFFDLQEVDDEYVKMRLFA
jgi:hypothetical protein